MTKGQRAKFRRVLARASNRQVLSMCTKLFRAHSKDRQRMAKAAAKRRELFDTDAVHKPPTAMRPLTAARAIAEFTAR